MFWQGQVLVRATRECPNPPPKYLTDPKASTPSSLSSLPALTDTPFLDRRLLLLAL